MEAAEKIVVKPLGAGCEVGRSCIHLKYKEKELLLDCGVHPAYTGVASLPFLDLIDLEKIDAVLITHFHLDHAAALPFLTEKTAFRGKVYMTYPTKAILKWLLNDYIRVINSSSDQDFYSEADLENCYNKIIPVDYHQQFRVDGIRVTALNAGHVLGAAMFLIEIENSKLLYTGDFSREEDRHLKAAESPGCKLDALITESTYGVQCHLPRVEREARFTSVVSSVVERGGRCLLPVFALGRAQELLLILEEYWEANPHLQKIPVYHVSALARRCMTVYQAYINMMNDRIQRISLHRNPFEFKYILNLKDTQSFRDTGPCVMMASPGMLQSGFSRELFERWCTDRRNGVVVSGYCVEGTLAKDILSEPKEVESSRGGSLRLNMSVEYISFSAHADYTQNSQFIDECRPDNLFFVHGEQNEMMRLRNSIQIRNEKQGVEMVLYTLRNGEEGSFEVSKINEAIVYTDKELFDGIIVDDNGLRIHDRAQLGECPFKELRLRQKQQIPFNSKFTLLKQLLLTEYDARVDSVSRDGADSGAGSTDGIVGLDCADGTGSADRHSVDGAGDAPGQRVRVGNILIYQEDESVVMEWECSYTDDVIAMAVANTIRNIGQSVKSIRLSKNDRVGTLLDVLSGYYREVHREEASLLVRWKDKEARIADVTTANSPVVGNDEALVGRVTDILRKVDSIFE